jgi:hypothetical protein
MKYSGVHTGIDPLSRPIVAMRVAIAVAMLRIPVLILMLVGVITIVASVAAGGSDSRYHHEN